MELLPPLLPTPVNLQTTESWAHNNHIDISLLQNLLGIAPLNSKQPRVQTTRPQLTRRAVMHRHNTCIIRAPNSLDLPLHIVDCKPGVGQNAVTHASPARLGFGEQTGNPVVVAVAICVTELRRDEKTLPFGLLEWRRVGEALVLFLLGQGELAVGGIFEAGVAELAVDSVCLRVLPSSWITGWLIKLPNMKYIPCRGTRLQCPFPNSLGYCMHLMEC